MIRRHRGFAGWFGLALAAGFFLGGAALAQVNLNSPQCVISKIDGERVPFPLRKANTKFELVENETYLLNGYLVNMSGRAFFRVDFVSQPWLETEKMLQFPFIPLDEMPYSINQLAGRLVQMAVVARRIEASSPIEERGSGWSLRPILPPVPVR